MTIEDAAELDSAFGRLRERHAGAAALAEHTLVGHVVVFRPASEILRGDLLQLVDRIGCGRMRGARMGVRRLAAAGDAGPRQVPARVAPRQLALLPRHADHFRRDAVHVAHRFGAQVPDAGLDIHPAVGLDDEEAVEPDRPGDERAHRHADAAYLRALTFPARGLPLVPLEEIPAAVERLLHERAGGVRARTLR